MIYIADGFIWPTQTPTVIDQAAAVTDFNVFAAAASYNSIAGDGGFTCKNTGTSLRRSRIVSKDAFPTQGKDRLVIGARFKMAEFGTGTSRSAFMTIGVHQIAPTPSSSANDAIDSGYLPPLTFGEGNNAGETGVGLVNPTSAAAGRNFSQYLIASTYNPLTGIDWAESHMFEVEYLFSANKINVYVDDYLLVSHDFAFTATHKTEPMFVYPQIACRNSAAPRLELLYVADERLGPVQMVPLLSDADVAVSAQFGTGPHFSKLSISSDGANGISAKQSGEALFSMQNLQGSPEVLAVRLAGSFSSVHKSAYETLGDVELRLRANGVDHYAPKKGIPSASYDNAITLFRNNPTTEAPWAVEDVNAAQAGFRLNIKDRF